MSHLDRSKEAKRPEASLPRLDSVSPKRTRGWSITHSEAFLGPECETGNTHLPKWSVFHFLGPACRSGNYILATLSTPPPPPTLFNDIYWFHYFTYLIQHAPPAKFCCAASLWQQEGVGVFSPGRDGGKAGQEFGLLAGGKVIPAAQLQPLH